MSVKIAFRSIARWHSGQTVQDRCAGHLCCTSIRSHLTFSVPLYSKWHETHKGVHRSSCWERFAKQVWTKVPGLWSSEIWKQRTDRMSVLTVPLRRRVVPSQFNWHRSQSIPRNFSPEDHELRRWYPRGNVHSRRVVRQHHHVPRLQ